jgi:hypothetical protein
MAYQFLVPNAVISNDIPASGWPSGLTIDQVWADGSISTRVRHVHSDGATLTRVGFTTYTLQSNERVAGIRTLIQIGQTAPILAIARLKDNVNMTVGFYSKIPFPTSPKLPVPGAWYAKDATDSGEWTQADLDGLEMYVYWGNPAGTYDCRIYDLSLQVDVVPQPTTVAIYPAPNDVIDITRPRFIWRVQQETDVTQNRYVLKVFTKAVAEGGGFDPETSTAYATITKTTSAKQADLALPEAALVFGDDYYWTVKAAVKFLNGTWFSDWSTPAPFSLNEPPTNDVQTPTGVVSTTNTPVVSWTYTDVELNVQSEALIRVFQQSGGTWVGFDPDVAVPVFQGTITDDSTSILCTTKLANTSTFRAYVKVAHKLSDGSTLWGIWNFNDFTTSFSAPAAPTLTVSPHNERVMLTMTPPAGPWTPDIDYFQLEKSLDGGVTWNTFRYGTLAKSTGFPDNTTPLVVYDYEVPFFTTVQYRAFSISTDLGLDVFSVASATASVSLNQNVVWIKDPSNASLNCSFRIEDSWLKRIKSRARSIHQPLGRSKPVVIRGSANASAFSTTLLVVGESDWAKLMSLVEADRTLYLQTPKGSWYVEIAADVNTEDRLFDRRAGEQDVWKITIPWQEVDFV